MKILIVANYNTGHFSPFVTEQVEAIRREQSDIEFDYFGVVGKGAMGYLGNLGKLKKKIRDFHPDIVHGHYGLSGLLATLQRKVPVVVTYHGSDIHSGGMVLKLSKIAMRMADYNIFVSPSLLPLANPKRNYSVVPCGINLDEMFPMDKTEAIRRMGWRDDRHYVLFSSNFDREVKNAPLAKAAVALLGNDYELVELKGFSREQVRLAMNACDCALMTSHNEGSPMFIKEAMSCNRPVVSTDVGDVREVTEGVKGCYLTGYDAEECASRIRQAIEYGTAHGSTDGRDRIIDLQLDNKVVARKVINIYQQILEKKNGL